MGGQKPYLLDQCRVTISGAETRLEYAPSTRFYLDDLQAGRPWMTRLPFPVHVVDAWRPSTGSAAPVRHALRVPPRLLRRRRARVPRLRHGGAVGHGGLCRVRCPRTCRLFSPKLVSHRRRVRRPEPFPGTPIPRTTASLASSDAWANAELLPDTILPSGLTAGRRAGGVPVAQRRHPSQRGLRTGRNARERPSRLGDRTDL